MRRCAFVFLFVLASVSTGLAEEAVPVQDAALEACKKRIIGYFEKMGAEEVVFGGQLVKVSQGNDFYFGWPPGAIRVHYPRFTDYKLPRRPVVSCLGSLSKRMIAWFTVNSEGQVRSPVVF